VAGVTGPVLRVTDLRKRYGDAEVVAGVTFDIRRGECFGLLGPNGAGKTTTLRLALGLIEPDGGAVELMGEAVPRYARRARRSVGVVPQFDNLDPDFTVTENLIVYGRYFGLADDTIQARIPELLDFAGLASRAGSRIQTLSGGMRRRLTLARALVNDPDFLVLDEPTTGLDPQARRLLWEALRALHQRGVTFILTTHYMEEADRLCQRLAIVDHGRILTLDTPAALKKSLPGAQVLDLWMRAPQPLAPRLREVPGVLNLEPVEAGGEDGVERLRLFVDPADGLLDRVLHAVRDGGADLHHVNLAQPSLEDVYIHLTGRGLRE
jgi:lipooligosaccharide transport system ATP-binding protein